MKILRSFFAVAALFLTVTPSALLAANAGAAGERIESFDSAAVLANDGSLSVTETIIYDFGANARHGIYRDILYLSTGPDGTRYRLGLDVGRVTVDGREAETDDERENGNLRIRIGDPDETVTGRHSYQIEYRFDRITLPEGGGRLLYNVTGNAWQVPIAAARFSLTYPGGGEAQARCYTGSAGSQAADCTVESRAGGLTLASNGTLAPGEGLTLDAALPAGAVTGFVEPYTPPLQTPAGLALAATSGLIALGGWLLVIGAYVKDHRHRTSRTAVAQYDAPPGYKPADMGFLIDEQAGRPEVAATLIDLAVRGYLKISPIKKEGIFGHDDFELTLTDPARLGELDEVERSLVDGIMNGATSMKLRDVDQAKSSKAVGELYGQISQRLADKGLYDRKLSAGQRAVPPVLLALAVAAVLVALGITAGSDPSPVGGLVVLGIGALVAAALVVAAWVAMRSWPRLSAAGIEELAYLRGLKLYLNVAEKDRLNFTDAPDKTPERFNKLLPFAVALGVEKQWAEQFKDIDVAPAVGGWYAGDPGTLSAVYLASSLNGFSNGVQNSIAAPSSGGAGGGFSGGGFGGGGGGSW